MWNLGNLNKKMLRLTHLKSKNRGYSVCSNSVPDTFSDYFLLFGACLIPVLLKTQKKNNFHVNKLRDTDDTNPLTDREYRNKDQFQKLCDWFSKLASQVPISCSHYPRKASVSEIPISRAETNHLNKKYVTIDTKCVFFFEFVSWVSYFLSKLSYLVS